MTDIRSDPSQPNSGSKRAISIRVYALIYILTTALMFIALLAVASYSYRYVLDERGKVSDRHVIQLRAAEELYSLYHEYEHTWKDILLRGHEPQSYHEYLSSFYELERTILSDVENQALALGQDTQSLQALRTFKEEFRQIGRLYRRALRTYNEAISDPQFAADEVTQNSIYDPVRRINELIDSLEASRQSNNQAISEEMQRFEIAIVLTMLFMIGLFLLVIYYMTSRFIISSINEGISVAEHISRGNLDNNISPESSTSEVTKLLLALRKMQENISQAQHELIAAKDEAEQSNKAKSLFLSRMSHELRTPLHAILGFGQILQMQNDSLTAQQQKNVTRIMDAGQHLLDLINEVLDLARIESNKLEITIDDIDLPAVLDECVTLMSPMAQKKSVSIINQLPEDHRCIVRGDLLRIKQALINLISNAIKYGPEYGKVILSSHTTENNMLRLEVADDGPGIPLEQQKSLFEPFKRLDESRFTEGTGIGLALTKQLVELMHGQIGVVSEPGKGSTFWLQLDLSDSSRNDGEPAENERAQGY